MTTEDDEDDKLFDVIGAIRAGVEVSQDESLPPVVREVGHGLAERSAAKLADLNRSTAASGDGSSADDHR